MPTILLLRHAQASFGAADYDVLSVRGHEQVGALVQDLDRPGTSIDRVLSGSLARQRDTAGPVARAAGRELEIDRRFNEYDSNDVLAHHSASAARQERPPGGEVPALTSREFQDVLEAALESWIEAGADGPTAESWDAFAARTMSACEELAAGLGSGETALVCTSGGVIGALAAALLAAPARTFIAVNRVTINTGITKLAHGRSGTTLVSFNEHTHLERPAGSLLTYR
jgi:broad specificity phosphatase PhoE